MFHIGQEVVCVNDSVHPRNKELAARNIIVLGGLDGLKKGTHYTIAGFEWDPLFEEQCVVLAELKRPNRNYFVRLVRRDTRGFAVWRFRPVQKRQTDISSLVALLNPVNHKKLEDA